MKNKKIYFISLICSIAICLFVVGKEIRSEDKGIYIKEYTAEEKKKMQNEFYIFRKNLIERLEKANSFFDIKDAINQGAFFLKNDYKKIDIKYNNEDDLIKISSEVDVKKLCEMLKNGHILLNDGIVSIMPYFEKKYPFNLYPHISIFYNDKAERWFISRISYLIVQDRNYRDKFNTEVFEKKEASIAGDNVNVRETAKVNSKVLIQLNKNDKIVVVDKTTEQEKIGGEKHFWYSIEVQKNGDKIRGWVYGKFIKIFDGK